MVPRYRNRGCASNMICRVLEVYGNQHMYLWCVYNKRLMDLYHDHGFNFHELVEYRDGLVAVMKRWS